MVAGFSNFHDSQFARIYEGRVQRDLPRHVSSAVRNVIGGMAAKFYSLAPADRQNGSSIVYYVRLNEVDHQITHENHILVTRLQQTQYTERTLLRSYVTKHESARASFFLTPNTNLNGVHLVS